MNMKKFNLTAQVTISISTTVEAETLEGAIEISKGREIQKANNWNTEEQAEEVWISDDFDGEPQNIHED